ncbi:MAG TPA: PQQ-binding-like beta-propeller repeat protein [Candidatus Acidoferrales bacterium]|nr:PQQ-binding-like beta-propeller repeat protein [Candidatus Acidoferrales bacterium]
MLTPGSTRKPLRLWPGGVLAILLCLLKFVVPVVLPDAQLYSVLGGVACGAAIGLWWLLLSRARWFERLGAIVLAVLGLYAARLIIDVSIATGAMGYLFPFLAIPIVSVAFVASAVVTRRLAAGPRRAAMAATILAACGSMALVRTGGFTASFQNDIHFRWAKTPEERLMAQAGIEPPAPPTVPVSAVAHEKLPATPPAEEPVKLPAPRVKSVPVAPANTATGPDWPGFRGPHRDSVVPGVRINTNWGASPPAQIWRRPVGPGWSSFAVHGDFIYTQEQRGPDEVVACYQLTTGKPLWAHRDAARFYESNGGPGPRGTPALSNGRVYTFGATGIVNALDAGNGAVVWSRNAASETGAKTPDWGFASSPLVVDDLVLIAASGDLIAYDRDTGARRWAAPARGVSYSSPHLATIGGVAQALLLSSVGLASFAPADGTLLWEHQWKGYPIVQPNLTADGDVLISVTDSSGTRRLAPAQGAGGWTVEERWTSNGLKPYFNDFVVHRGYAFGFDGSILSCIDLADGKRKWKGGRYGNGQLVLLADQDVLLVLSELGELALVGATPDQFTELARFPALEGKTWNHPVLAGDVLLVRNGEEMAAFRLALAGR